MEKKRGYERAEVTFAKDNKMEMELYEFLIEKSTLLGKGKYIKNLIYEEMKKATEK